MDGYRPGYGQPRYEQPRYEQDAADQWVLDPVTGEYRLREPQEQPPAAAPAARPAETTRMAPAAPEPPRADPSRTAQPRTAQPREGQPRAHRSGSAPEPPRGPRSGRRAAAAAAEPHVTKWPVGLAAAAIVALAVGLYVHQHISQDSLTNPSPTYAASTPPASPSPTPSPKPTKPKGPTDAEKVKKAPLTANVNVRVDILDASGKFGQGGKVLTFLQNFDNNPNLYFLRSAASKKNPDKPIAHTRLDYNPKQASQAHTLLVALKLPFSIAHQTGKDTAPDARMTLELGEDFTAPGKPLAK